MSKELTPWFPASVVPVRRGWYVVRSTDDFYQFIEEAQDQRRPVKRFWNGRRWEWKNPSGLMRPADFSKTDEWRGLAKKP